MPDSDLTLLAAKEGIQEMLYLLLILKEATLLLVSPWKFFIFLVILFYIKWDVYVNSSHNSIYQPSTTYILFLIINPILFFLKYYSEKGNIGYVQGDL